jgi:hypothetical protein
MNEVTRLITVSMKRLFSALGCVCLCLTLTYALGKRAGKNGIAISKLSENYHEFNRSAE